MEPLGRYGVHQEKRVLSQARGRACCNVTLFGASLGDFREVFLCFFFQSQLSETLFRVRDSRVLSLFIAWDRHFMANDFPILPVCQERRAPCVHRSSARVLGTQRGPWLTPAQQPCPGRWSEATFSHAEMPRIASAQGSWEEGAS